MGSVQSRFIPRALCAEAALGWVRPRTAAAQAERGAEPQGAGVAPPSLRFVVVGFDPDLLLFWTGISKQASCRSAVPLRFPFP